MKKMLKTLSLICVFALAITAFAVLAAADGADGQKENIIGADALTEEFLLAKNATEKLAKAKALYSYLDEKSVTETDALAYYADKRCADCADDESLCSGCAATAELRAAFMYARYKSLVGKIMAYGAASLSQDFNPGAAVSDCTETRLWLEKFLTYGLSSYTVAQALSPDFFDGYALGLEITDSLSIAADGKITYTLELINSSDEAAVIEKFSDIPAAFASVGKLTLGGSELSEQTDYTFDAKSSAPIINKITVPAATYEKDAQSGEVSLQAGRITLVAEGEVLSGYVEKNVTVDGGVATYTFRIWNTSDKAIDSFRLSVKLDAWLGGLTAEFGGTKLRADVNYTYDVASGNFTTRTGTVTVGAATEAPAVATLTVSGNVRTASLSDEKIDVLANKVVDKVKSIEITDGYRALVDAFVGIDRRYSKITDRTNARVAVDTYASNHRGSIDTESALYKSAYANYQQYSTYLANDKASYELVVAMEKYLFFDTYVRKLEYYQNAESVMKNVAIDDSITEAGETRLRAALLAYNRAAAELETMLRTQNSKYFIMYMEYTQNYETVEAWEANYDDLKYPVSKAREIVKEGRYDPTYEGVAELLLWYEAINDYFYDKLQEEHVEFISGLLDKYTVADTYMEKLGICTRVQTYIDSSDISSDNIELQRLVEKNAEYLLEIKVLEEPYLAQRDRKTEMFTYAVMKLEAADTYNEIKAFLAEAAECYYGMTIGATDVLSEEEVVGAIAKYDYYVAYAEKMEESSESFKLTVATLETKTSYPERYLLIVRAGSFVDYITEDIDGVSEAYAKYLAALEDYVALTATSAAEVAEVQSLELSLRLGRAPAVSAFFAKLLGFVFN